MTGSATAARLREAAQDVIAAEGWAAATTRRVAERAGVNQGLVHYHVGSIEQLRREAVIEGVREFFAEALDRPDSGPADASVVGRWTRSLIADDLADPRRARLARLLQESLVAAGRDDALREGIAAMLVEYRTAVTTTLESLGVSQARDTAVVVTALLDGALLQKLFDPALDLEPIAAGIDALVMSRVSALPR